MTPYSSYGVIFVSVPLCKLMSYCVSPLIYSLRWLTDSNSPLRNFIVNSLI